MKKIFKYFMMVIAIIIVIFLFDYNCPFYNKLGIPCAGCGITRAFKCLIQFDLKGVFLHNASIFLYALVAVVFLFRSKIKNFKYIIGFLVVLIIIYYFTRLYLYYPDTYPMIMKDDTIIYNILEYFNNH